MILRCADRPYRAWTDESKETLRRARVGLAPNSGEKADISRSRRRAKALNRCAIARCAGSPTVSAVTGGKIAKT